MNHFLRKLSQMLQSYVLSFTCLSFFTEKLKDIDPEEINIKVKATLEMFAVYVCSPEKVITDVKIKGTYCNSLAIIDLLQ